MLFIEGFAEEDRGNTVRLRRFIKFTSKQGFKTSFLSNVVKTVLTGEMNAIFLYLLPDEIIPMHLLSNL